LIALWSLGRLNERPRPPSSDRAVSAARLDTTDTHRLVMLVVDHEMASATFARGSSAADALRAQIFAVLAISPGFPPERATRVISQVATELRHASAPHGSILDVCRGAAAQVARSVARTVSPMMIIVGAAFGAIAACRLAADMRTPVLVARTSPRGRSVIAASDMTRLDLPVLSRARELAHDLDRPLTFIHNARPIADTGGCEGLPSPDLLRLEREVVAAKSARLRAFAGGDEMIETIVTRIRRRDRGPRDRTSPGGGHGRRRIRRALAAFSLEALWRRRTRCRALRP
jgi:hypothetical protein